MNNQLDDSATLPETIGGMALVLLFWSFVLLIAI